MSDHQDETKQASYHPSQLTGDLPDAMESMFLDDAPKSGEIHHTIEIDQFEEEWELYPTLANVPTNTQHEIPSFPPEAPRALDKDTSDRLKETFQALSTLELDAFVEGSLDEVSDEELDDDFEEDVIPLHTLAEMEVLSIDELKTGPDLDVLDPFAVSGLHVLDDDDIIEIGEDVEEILDPLSSTVNSGVFSSLMDVQSNEDSALFVSSALTLQELDTSPRKDDDFEKEVTTLARVEDVERNDGGDVQQRLRVAMEGVGGRVELRMPWARYLAELRLETLSEPEANLRTLYMYVFASLLRLHGEPGVEAARQVEDAVESVLAPFRPLLVQSMAAAWRAPMVEFKRHLEALTAFDTAQEVPHASLRHISIAVARVFEDILTGAPDESLLQQISASKSLLGMTAQALALHRQGDHMSASGYWQQIARYVGEQDQQVLYALASHSMRKHPTFCKRALDHASEASSRLLWKMVQVESCRQGSFVQEAQALAHLIGELTRELGEQPTPEQLDILSAYYMRLAFILRALQRAEVGDGDELEAEEAKYVLLRAIDHASEPVVYLRHLVRWCEQEDDQPLMIQALEQLLHTQDDPAARALIHTQLAQMVDGEDASGQRLDHLKRAISLDLGCLPALIALGQEYLLQDDWQGVMQVRTSPGGGNTKGLGPSWRRAELLERANGDPKEILSLYRNARHEHPEDVHLFWAVERALSVLGQWRGLRNLFETTQRERPALVEALQARGYNVTSHLLAVETYLEAIQQPSIEVLSSDYSARQARLGDDVLIDEPLFWRQVTADMQARRVDEALARIEWAQEHIASRSDEAAARVAMWHVYLVGWLLKQPERCLASYRLLFEHAQSGMLRRFAFHGLLRLKDMSWLAQQLYLADGETNDLVAIFGIPHEQRPLFGQAFSAELLHLGGESHEATARLSALAEQQHDAGYRQMLQHRAMSLALSGRAWPQVQTLLMRADADDERQRHANEMLVLQLNVCRDEPLPLDQLDIRTGAMAASPAHALSELETCLRLRQWSKALDVIDLAIASTVDRRGPYRTFLTMLGTIVAEWGVGQPEVTYNYAKSWSSLAQEHGGEWEMLWMLAAWYRSAAALAYEEESLKVLETVKTHFDQSVASLLKREVELNLNQSPIKDVVEWYTRHVQKVQGAERQYVYVCSVLLHWLFGERTQKSAQYLADAHSRDHDALQLLAFINVIAHRDVGMSASMERYLDGLTAQLRTPELGQWSRVRGLFHLSVTQNCLEEGLVQASTMDTIDAWLSPFQLLLQRALGTQESIEWASRETLSEDAQRVAQLESALIRANWEEIHQLADLAVPGAIVHMELRAAHERRDWCVQENLELQHMALRRSLVNDAQDMVRRRFMAYIQHTAPSIVASPWCPLRLVDYDISRLGLTVQELDELHLFAERTHALGVGAEIRLIVARQLMRAGRRDDAVSLVPRTTGDDLVSLAWFWLTHALDPTLSVDVACAHILAAWQLRASHCDPLVQVEVDYEVARAMERTDADASAVYTAVLTRAPGFVPASVSLSRLLIRQQDWAQLAQWWSNELEGLQDDEARANQAYKLGWLYEHRLVDDEQSLHMAVSYYEQVLLYEAHHVYALHALLRLSYQQQEYERCVQSLQALVRASASGRNKATYLLELAAIYENHMSLPAQALRHYQEAAQLMPERADALLGALRVDEGEMEASMRLLEARVERLPTREGRSHADAAEDHLADLLFLVAEHNRRADYVLSQRYPNHMLWRMSQLIEALTQGELHEEALQLVREGLQDEQVGMCFALLNVAQASVRRQPGFVDVLAQMIQDRAHGEGLYISTLSRALAERDLETLIAMGRVGAMRALDDAMRAAEWTRAAIFLRWSGEAQECLDVCKRLLERVPDFLPAVKLARLVSAELPDWPALAAFSAREADLSRQPSIAVRARVEASEVQRRYLGDLDAAQNQLTIVLQDNPKHDEAFDKLKQILLQKQQIPAVLKLCEQRLPNIASGPKRVALLNEMADLSMNSGQDPRRTIQYLNMSLKEEPHQLRRLRVLAELYDSLRHYEQAAMCYEAAIQLTQDQRLCVRLWFQVAHIYEYKLENLDSASRAYEQVLKIDGESLKALESLVRIYEHKKDFFHAMSTLERLAKCAKTPEEIRRAKIAHLELSLRGNIPNEGVIRSAKEVLVQYPDYRNASKLLSDRLAQSGRAHELDSVFRAVVMDALRVHPHPPLQEFYQHAKKLYLSDLSYSIAATARWRGLSNREMNQFHDNSKMRHKLPSAPLPIEQTAGVLPSDLSVSFFEIIRRSSPGILLACDPVPYSQFTKRRFRLSQPNNAAMQAAFQWPTLYSLNLRDVYTADKLPLGSGVINLGQGEVRLVLDQSWNDARNRDKLLVRLGTQLAASSMGVGLWSAFGRDAQYALFVMTMRAVVPNWGPRQAKAKYPSWFQVDRYERWLQREGNSMVAPYVLEMSGRMGPAALPNQFMAVELAMERLGCVVLPDPSTFLPHTARFGVDNGLHHRPWTFVFSPTAARLRQAIGVAYTT